VRLTSTSRAVNSVPQIQNTTHAASGTESQYAG